MSKKQKAAAAETASAAPVEAFDRLHQAASTTAADQPVNVLAGDLQALLNVVGPPGGRAKPADPETPELPAGSDPTTPPA